MTARRLAPAALAVVFVIAAWIGLRGEDARTQTSERLSAATIQRLEPACRSFVERSLDHAFSIGPKGLVKQARALQEARARLARAMRVGAEGLADRARLARLASLIETGNVHLRAAATAADTGEMDAAAAAMAPYNAAVKREGAMAGRMGLTSCTDHAG